MPQIQVLGREQLEERNNLQNQILERQRIQQDARYKSEMLKYYSDELKMKAKLAQDEAQRALLAQEAEDAKLVATAMKNASEIAEKQGGSAAQDYLMGVFQLNPERFFSLQQFYDRVGNVGKSGEERILSSVADRLERELAGGGVGVAPEMGETASTPAPVADTNQARVSAINNPGFVISDIDVKGVKLSNQAENVNKVRLETRARKEEERDIELSPIRNSVNFYIDTFNNAVEEMGGLSSSAIESLAKGTANEVWSRIGSKPNTLALQQMSQSVALQLGSYLNKGRPTEQDAAAAAKMLVKLTLTKEANEILKRYLNIVVSGKDMYLGRDARGETHYLSPAADKIYEMLKTGRVPKEDFIVVEIK